MSDRQCHFVWCVLIMSDHMRLLDRLAGSGPQLGQHLGLAHGRYHVCVVLVIVKHLFLQGRTPDVEQPLGQHIGILY